ncbi:histidine--tRNA ligase [Myxococcota bacterium]|nr:histidine--tRNA ligase [Myxococcota bacterium]MBU1533927.1 histidine--tRNA ligase [Myxococcota bacterium]
MASFSVKPPSGMRDFLPEEILRRRSVIAVISKIYEEHGFLPLETPTMERLDVLLGKYGEEGDRLVFKVLHRGAKLEKALEQQPVKTGDLAELGLRYDLTVPLARVYALHREKLGTMFKRYQIQPVWRADRPARGRFREFFQCDVDIIGSREVLAEMDIFMAVCEIMELLGFEDFSLHINHRGLLSATMEAFGVPKEKETEALVILDKLDKIGRDAVMAELEAKLGATDLGEKLAPLFNLVEEKGTFEDLKKYYATVSLSAQGVTALEELEKLHRWSSELGNTRLFFHPLLARGLDYYTGPIYELRLENESASLGGGGRYDGLIGSFCGGEIPAVGFSFGLERLLVLMEERGMFDSQGSESPVCIAALEEEHAAFALSCAASLRKNGVRVDIFPGVTSPSKVFKWADRSKVRFVILIGGEEVESGRLTVKDMSNGALHQDSLQGLHSFFKK